MEYKIIVSIGATEDTNEAYIFYEGQQKGLGDRFLDELAHFYEKLKHHPTYYSFVSDEKTIRALSLKVFPYKIIYEIEDNELYVFAIHHFRQNSDHFLKRL
jgi:mRNA-degrading endonuclease RelE of RelBE toxin-antitoxin system